MATYAADHADALATLTAEGAPASFTHAVTTRSESTGAVLATVTTVVAGYAIGTKGNPTAYAALGLIETETRTLLFVASDFGAVPTIGSSVTWGGIPWTVRSVLPRVALDGVPLLMSIVVSR